MVKTLQRTPAQKEYRDNLAHDFKELRKCGNTGRDLAKTFLKKEQETETYKDSETKNLRNNEINREKLNNRIIEIIDTKDYATVDNYIRRSSNYILDVDVAKRLIEKGWQNIIFGLFKTDKFRPSDEMIELFLSLGQKKHDFEWLGNYLFHMGKDPKVYGCLTEKSVEKLIDAGILRRTYIANLCIFRGLNKETLFKILDNRINIEDYEDLLYNLDNFNGLDKEAFNALVFYGSAGPYLEIIAMHGDNPWETYFGKKLEKFEGLGEEEAKFLIEKGCGHYVAKHPEKFGLKKEK